MNSVAKTLATIILGDDCAPKEVSTRAKITARDNLVKIFMMMLLIVVVAKIGKSGLSFKINQDIKFQSNIGVGMISHIFSIQTVSDAKNNPNYSIQLPAR